MCIVDSIDFLTTWAFRLGLVALGTGLIFWLATAFIRLAFPEKGVAIPAVQIVGGTRIATHGEMLSHLLSSELGRIRNEFTTAVGVLNNNLAKWQPELVDLLQKESSGSSAEAMKSAPDRNFAVASQQISVTSSVGSLNEDDITRGLQHLTLFAESLGGTKPPEIRVSGVDFGSVFQWLADRVLPKSPHSLMLIEDGPRAIMLASGPLFGDGTAEIELGSANPALSPKEIVEPVAYHMLANSLRKLDKPINFGDWTAIQQFVRGLTEFAYDARLAEPTSPAAIEKRKQHRAEIIEKLLGAAEKITDKSPGPARDIVSFASFFAGLIGEYGLAADALDKNASLFSDQDSSTIRQKRVELLRNRDLTFAVEEAVRSGASGNGSGLTAAASKIATRRAMKAALARHHLKGGLVSPAPTSVKVAIVGAEAPGWLGLGAIPGFLNSERNLMADYVGELVQLIRALTPNVTFSFFPVGNEEARAVGSVMKQDLIAAIVEASKSDAQIVVIPVGPINDAVTASTLVSLKDTGKLVIVPAGNRPEESFEVIVAANLRDSVLFAASIRPDGSLSKFSATPAGALAVIGEYLPVAVVGATDVRFEQRAGTGPATAVLAAIAVETRIRFPNLPMSTIRDRLLAAARKTSLSKVPVAVVP